MTIVYGTCLFISVFTLIYMAQKNYNNIDIYHWTIMILVAIVIMAYWLKTRITSADAASALMCFQYLDSSYLFCVVIFYLLHNAGFSVKSWFKIALYGLASVHMMIVCLCFNTDLYYSSIRVVETELGNAVHVTAGPMMVFHYIYLGIMLLIIAWVVVVCIRQRGRYAAENLLIYLSIPVASFVLYVVEGAFSFDFSLLPLAYSAAVVVIGLHYDFAHAHDIGFIIADHHKKDSEQGYAAIGLNGRFLSANERAMQLLPVLNDVKVNQKLPDNDSTSAAIWSLIRSFEGGISTQTRYKLGDMSCACDISYFSLSEGGSHQGYLLNIRDITEEQKVNDKIRSYNERLSAEVAEKTEDIRGMQHKIVLGMADLIENRDNNTGGHVKRTSDIIRIIVDEIRKQGKIPLSDQMAEDIVRAAPTHDLGKIQIDNSILNKPGKFTDEEYEIMKTHSPKSGDLVMILLDGVEEDRFVRVAYNVARYHHERWDGRGYPEGLVGTMIPLEARIMAVADVYDALVSKRVYKDPMSFEKSASIMCDCMGTQFDPNMKSVFLGCREKLEQYYLEHD